MEHAIKNLKKNTHTHARAHTRIRTRTHTRARANTHAARARTTRTPHTHAHTTSHARMHTHAHITHHTSHTSSSSNSSSSNNNNVIYPLKCFTSENHRQWFKSGKLGYNTLVIILSSQTIPKQCMELFAVWAAALSGYKKTKVFLQSDRCSNNSIRM